MWKVTKGLLVMTHWHAIIICHGYGLWMIFRKRGLGNMFSSVSKWKDTTIFISLRTAISYNILALLSPSTTWCYQSTEWKRAADEFSGCVSFGALRFTRSSRFWVVGIYLFSGYPVPLLASAELGVRTWIPLPDKFVACSAEENVEKWTNSRERRRELDFFFFYFLRRRIEQIRQPSKIVPFVTSNTFSR